MDFLRRDLRFALRRLARSPGFTAIVTLTIGVGAGANAAVVSGAHTLLWQPPPGVLDAGRLVAVVSTARDGGYEGLTSGDAASLVSRTDTFAGLLSSRDAGHTLLDGPDGSLIDAGVAEVSASYFSTLGLTPAAGSLVLAGADAAVIANRLWIGAGLPGAAVEVGDVVTINGVERRIAGVAPPGFLGLSFGGHTSVWIPLPEGVLRGDAPTGIADATRARLDVVARLADGVSPADAERVAASVLQTTGAAVRPFSRLDPALRLRVVRITLVLVGATVLVLLVAGVNGGAMVLSRGMNRAHDLAIRQAVGATTRDLIRDLLAESLLLATAAAAIGVALSLWAGQLIPSLFGPEHAEGGLIEPGASWTTVATSGVAFLFTLGLFVIGPLVQGLQPMSLDALHGHGSSAVPGRHGARARSLLVVVQIALSCVLLVLSIVLAGVLDDALWVDAGLTSRQAAIVSLEQMPSSALRPSEEAVRALPRVLDVAWINTPPLIRPARREFDLATPDGPERHEIPFAITSANYFEAMQMPMLDGRPYDAADDFRAPLVVVVNDVMAQRYLGGNAVGKTLAESHGRPVRIVGVVRSVRYRTLERPQAAVIYYPLSQNSSSSVTMIVRTRGVGEPLVEPVLDAWSALGVPARVQRARSFESHLSAVLAADLVTRTLIAAAGVMALFLTTVGVYGVMADAVARRRREIGVCAALGAPPRQIVRLVLTGGFRLAGTGALAGLVAGAASWGALRSALEGVPPITAWPFLVTMVIVAAMSAVAALMPAQRALRIHPIVVMRQE